MWDARIICKDNEDGHREIRHRGKEGNILYFNNETLENIITELQRHFGIRVAVKIYEVPMPTCVSVDEAGRVLIGANNSGYQYMMDKDGNISKIVQEPSILDLIP